MINLSNEKVIVLGDLNDDISEPHQNNVFQDVLDDSDNYQFGDLIIAPEIARLVLSKLAISSGPYFNYK